MNKILVIIFIQLLLASTLVEASDNNVLLRPPAWSKNQFILSLGRLTPGSDIVDRSLSEDLTMMECGSSNTISRNDEFDIDYESHECALYLEKSIEGIKTSINGAFYRTGGGVFDSLIESYHEGLGLPNGSRGRTPEDRFNVSGDAGSGANYNLDKSNITFIDPQISISIPVFEDDEGGMYYLDVSTTIPLSLDQFSLDRPEFKTNLVFESNRKKDYAYQFGVSAILHTDSKEHNISYPLFSSGIFSSLQFLYSEKLIFLTQGVLSSSLEREVPGFYNYSFYLDLGVRYFFTKDHAVEFIFRENPTPGKGTVDISGFIRFIF